MPDVYAPEYESNQKELHSAFSQKRTNWTRHGLQVSSSSIKLAATLSNSLERLNKIFCHVGLLTHFVVHQV